MRKNRKLILKYLLLISVLMLMMLLCACRTRLTNNTEVAQTIADEDGWLTEEYQMRRDMIGEPVAERPVFTGWSSDDDSDYYDSDTDAFDNYDQGTEDTWDEPDDTAETTPPSTSTPGTSTPTTNRNPGRSSNNSNNNSNKKNEKTDVETVKLSIDLNDGDGVVNTISVEKGSKFKKYLPEVQPPDGYKFNGWHKHKTKNTPVDPEAKITESCTIYAHWVKKEEPKKDYAVKWEYDSDVIVADADKLPATIKQGEKFPDPLPAAHKKDYRFRGWYDGNDFIAAGQECTGDSRLVAKFDSWEEIYNYAAPYTQGNPPDEQKQTFVAEDGTSGLARGIDWTTVASPAAGPNFVIVTFDNPEFTQADADAAAAAKRAEDAEKYKNSTMVFVPKAASDKKNELYYKLLLHTLMYGDLDGFDRAADDTEAETAVYFVSAPPAA